MDSIAIYQRHIRAVLEEYAQLSYANIDLEAQIVMDTKRHHYSLLRFGWSGKERIFSVVFHLDIKDEKIWIQEDHSEIGIATLLVERGIPKSQIVLAYLTSESRKYTEFAVN